VRRDPRPRGRPPGAQGPWASRLPRLLLSAEIVLRQRRARQPEDEFSERLTCAAEVLAVLHSCAGFRTYPVRGSIRLGFRLRVDELHQFDHVIVTRGRGRPDVEAISHCSVGTSSRVPPPRGVRAEIPGGLPRAEGQSGGGCCSGWRRRIQAMASLRHICRRIRRRRRGSSGRWRPGQRAIASGAKAFGRRRRWDPSARTCAARADSDSRASGRRATA
jgi:hypothetical protein